MSRAESLIPRTFRTFAPTDSNEALMARYGVSLWTISDWRRQTGIRGTYRAPERPRQLRSMPAGFKAVARDLTVTQLKDRYDAGRETVLRWLSQAGIECRRGRPGGAKTLSSPPAMFASVAPTMLRTQLAKHYSVSPRTIARWLKEAGADAMKREPKRPASVKVGYRPRAPQNRKWNVDRSHLAANHVTRDTSTEGQAADHLRRFAPVYRCDERGRQLEDGKKLTHWRFGMVVCTAEELIERARAKGWSPDDWRTLPAFQTPGGRDAPRQQGA